jgi:DSF synthase
MTNSIVSGLPTTLFRPYRYLRLQWTSEFSMLTVRMGVKPIQCYSLAAMAELQQVFNDISASPGLVRHFVIASDVPRVFNFGGDLSLFVLLVRARDLDSLRLYARRCIELIWWVENAGQLGVYTTALVQGDTLGGGLESALVHDSVIFERGAQAGYPEVLFNLFPGMGAWNLTIRRAGYAVANDMILSGKIYTADQLHRRGLVDLLADDGAGESVLEQMARTIEPRFRGTLAALNARRIASPITYDSLQAIAEHWVTSALGLANRDMRLMERLARAQVRKVGGAEEGAVEEIKRMELDTAWDFERTGQSEWATLT